MHKENARRAMGMVLRSAMVAPLTDAQLLQAFVRDRSAEAFTEIVRRHGSMVFGVCRRVLRQEQDAEDAFQGTFLVLVRKASLVRPADSLGRWLYGVAFRTAQKAKSRRYREECQRAALLEQPLQDTVLSPDPLDWLPLLDQELNRLSPRDRLPIVLCDLLGKSRREAAEELGLSEGTLSSRLARARERLKLRLERRGVIPSISVTGLIVGTCEASAALIESCSMTALGSINPRVTQLVEGVVRSMFLQSMVKPLWFVAAATAIAGSIFWWYSPKTEPNINSIVTAAEVEKDKTPKPKTDEERIQGLWIVKEAEIDGKKDHPDAADVLNMELNFKDARVVITKDGKSKPPSDFKLDSNKTPKEFEFNPTVAQSKDRAIGIYELKGGTLRLCFHPKSDRERPKSFETKGTGFATLTLERKQKTLKGAERLTALRKELVQALKVQLSGLDERLRIGRGPLMDVYYASNRLMEVELELAANKQERLKVMEANLKRFQGYEKVMQDKFNSGTTTMQEVAQAKARRLEVEILIETEKGE